MIDTKASHISRLILVLDICLTLFVFLVSFWLGVYFFDSNPDALFSYVVLSPIILMTQSYVLLRLGVYRNLSVRSYFGFALSLIKAISISILIFFTFLFALKFDGVSRGVLLIFVVINFFVLFSMRSLLVWWYFDRAAEKGENFQKVLIIGTGERAQRLCQTLISHSEWGIDVIGHVDTDQKEVNSSGLTSPILGRLDEIEDILSSRVVDEVILAIPRAMMGDVQPIVDACEEQGVRFRLMADIFNMQVSKTHLVDLDGIPLLTFEPVAQNPTDLLIKRLFDLSAVLITMPIVLPIMAAVALAIKLEAPGPALFVQQRVGFRKRKFPMYKFRSMHVDAEERLKDLEHLNESDGPNFKITNDPRVTKVGKFIRRTSLDELPQLFNVILGHMSLVGPRPMSTRDVDLFDRGIQRKRFSVKPGLTCIWQISGRSNLTFDQWLELDLKYIDTWSLELDFKILIKTIPAVLFSRGAV